MAFFLVIVRRLLVKSLALLAALLLAMPARAALHLPAPPGSGQYVVDLAEAITPEDEEKIQTVAEQLWTDQQTQLVVVAIDSMAQYGGLRMSIEDFAAVLYREWSIGAPEGQGPDENRGMLLLLSRLDRKARIELGAGWGHDKDSESWQLMQSHLVPAFKRLEFSSGLAHGATALSSMARGQGLPRAPLTQEMMLGIAGGGVLLLFTVISLLRSGSSGYAWGLWSAVFTVLWGVLSVVFAILTSGRHHHHHWGHSHWDDSHSSGHSWGSSGSSFGGGSSSSSSSGGGGATGSW